MIIPTMISTNPILTKVNWQQSLLDGSFQFIFTVVIAYLITNHSAQRTNDRKVILENLNSLEADIFQLKRYYDEIISNLILFLEVSEQKSDKFFGPVFIEESKVSNFYEITEEIEILKIKIQSKFDLLSSKKANIQSLQNDCNAYLRHTEYFLNTAKGAIVSVEDHPLYIVNFEFTESGNVLDHSDYFTELLFEAKTIEETLPFSSIYKKILETKSIYY